MNKKQALLQAKLDLAKIFLDAIQQRNSPWYVQVAYLSAVKAAENRIKQIVMTPDVPRETGTESKQVTITLNSPEITIEDIAPVLSEVLGEGGTNR